MALDIGLERIFADAGRRIVARGTDYHDGDVVRHHHSRNQFLHGFAGVVTVATAQGTWVMPPRGGIWIPAGVEHEVHMRGRVRTHSLYFEPATVADMPNRCLVLGMTDFMRGLLEQAVDVPAVPVPDRRAEALLTLVLDELRRLPILPLALPFPAHAALHRRCRAYLARPSVHDTIEDWSEALGMSRRTFTRLFRQETGSSFVAWRQQACLMAALPRLAAGEAVTTIALDLGYDNPAAFTTMFRRALGKAPRAYFTAAEERVSRARQ